MEISFFIVSQKKIFCVYVIVFQCIVMMEFINSQIIIHGNSIKTFKLAAEVKVVKNVKTRSKKKLNHRQLFR